MKKAIYFAALLVLTGCATATTNITGTSYADDMLKRDVKREIKTLENSCTLLGQKGIPVGSVKIVHQEPVAPPKTATDPWEEIWTVQRNGYIVQYKIYFTPTPEQGGCNIRVSALFKTEDYQ